MALRPVLSCLVLCVAAVLVPVAASTPASATVQPCSITYAGTGGAIRPGPDAGKDHAWHAWILRTDDARVVTDLDVAVDLVHPNAQDLKVNLMSPATTGLLPNVVAFNLGQVSGKFDGLYRFDDEASAKVSGANPSPGAYQPYTPLTTLEAPPTAGEWSIWLLNYGTSTGQVRSWSITVTYATCDSDGDGIEDRADSCRFVLNPEQVDRDADGLGDECDADRDGDAVTNVSDGCPDVAAATASGCPTAARTVRARYLTKKHALSVKVGSYYPECQAAAPATLWRVKKGTGVRVKQFATTKRGVKVLRLTRRGRYYVTVDASYATGVAECSAAQSKRVRVRR